MMERKTTSRRYKGGQKKTRTATSKAGRTTTKTVNRKGRITSVTKTKADGTTKTLGKDQVAARNKLKSGKGKVAKATRNKLDALRIDRRAAKKSGDIDTVKKIRKEERFEKRAFTGGVKNKRAKAAERKSTPASLTGPQAKRAKIASQKSDRQPRRTSIAAKLAAKAKNEKNKKT